MKILKIFVGKSQEILEEHDADTFGDLNKEQFSSCIAQCPFLSQFDEDSVESLYNSLVKNVNVPLQPKWEGWIETCDLSGCLAKMKEEGGGEKISTEVEKDELVAQKDEEGNVNLLAVFNVMNKAQSNL